MVSKHKTRKFCFQQKTRNVFKSYNEHKIRKNLYLYRKPFEVFYNTKLKLLYVSKQCYNFLQIVLKI